MEDRIIPPFWGTVVLLDWFKASDDRDYKRITGYISIVNDKALVGFTTRGANSANWGCMITSGPNAEESSHVILIMGCQVRAVERKQISSENLGSFVVVN